MRAADGGAEKYWDVLTPEKTFLARVFLEQCVAVKDNVRFDSAMPVVTLLAFRIGEEYNTQLGLLREGEEEDLMRRGVPHDAEEEEHRARRDEDLLAALGTGHALGRLLRRLRRDLVERHG